MKKGLLLFVLAMILVPWGLYFKERFRSISIQQAPPHSPANWHKPPKGVLADRRAHPSLPPDETRPSTLPPTVFEAKDEKGISKDPLSEIRALKLKRLDEEMTELSDLWAKVLDPSLPVDKREYAAAAALFELGDDEHYVWWSLVHDRIFELRSKVLSYHSSARDPKMLPTALELFQRGTMDELFEAASFIGTHEAPEAKGLFDGVCRPRLEGLLFAPDDETRGKAAVEILRHSQLPLGGVVVAVKDLLQRSSDSDSEFLSYWITNSEKGKHIPEFFSTLCDLRFQMRDEKECLQFLKKAAAPERDEPPECSLLRRQILEAWTQHENPEVAAGAKECLDQLTEKLEQKPDSE